MKEKDIDILEFLMTADFENLQYSSDQYVFFLKKYQSYYKILNSKYHGVKHENERIISEEQKAKDQLLKEQRSNAIDKAKVKNLDKELKKKLTWKERFKGKLIGRFDPNNI